mmetsp:Transcript_66973/g.205105  ORF Transcript_66973/g.205105 Transcript_66973/m.205105 type:complete len:200 (+) Transcript_66973:2659-3258(+)
MRQLELPPAGLSGGAGTQRCGGQWGELAHERLGSAAGFLQGARRNLRGCRSNPPRGLRHPHVPQPIVGPGGPGDLPAHQGIRIHVRGLRGAQRYLRRLPLPGLRRHPASLHVLHPGGGADHRARPGACSAQHDPVFHGAAAGQLPLHVLRHAGRPRGGCRLGGRHGARPLARWDGVRARRVQADAADALQKLEPVGRAR